MKKIKKVISIILIVSVVLGISGCTKGESEENVQRYAWPLGTASPKDTVTQIYAEKFADEVDRLSNGKMKIQVYANSVLGGDRELLESCKDGDIPFVVQNTAPQVAFMPETAVFDMPSVFSSIEEARGAVDNNEFYSLIQRVYEKSGYKLLGYADQGFRVMTTNKKVEALKDFKGQKIRTMENSNHITFWKTLGANPTPMTFSEVYIGLQQGTIDAQENPYEVIASSKIYEQQKYVVQTNHLPHFISLVVSDDFYKKLSKDKQDIIDEAAKTAKEYARELADKRIAEKIEKINDSGTEKIDISEKLQQEIREASKPVYETVRKQAGNEIVNAYLQVNQ
jgi:tripartite ATP-independent transporter DctP family solute receptor